jgi:hypothetical protein
MPFMRAPTAAGGVVALAERREVHDAHHRLLVHGERDQVRPDLDAVGEVLRPVDRIDDPPSPALALAGRPPRPGRCRGEALLHGLPDRGLDR